MTDIRPARISDASRLAQLSGVLGYPVSTDSMARRLGRVLARAEDVIFVAGSPAGIVGWIHGAERDTLESELRCEILGLVVDRDHRSRGVGRRLVAAVEAWAAARVKTSHIYRKPIGNRA